MYDNSVLSVAQQTGQIDRNSGSGFHSIDEAGIAAAGTVMREQKSLIACEPYCLSSASTEVGTFIREERSWFSRTGTYGWDRPGVWGAVGQEQTIWGGTRYPSNADAWVVGVGRYGSQQIPTDNHFRILRRTGADVGYFAAPSGAVRRFDNEGSCTTIYGSAVSGC